jgi:HSP20 family protein
MNTMQRRRSSQSDLFHREIDRLFSDFFPTASGDEGGSTSWAPRADVYETEDDYQILLDLPGVPAEGVQVHYDDGVLSVRGERRVREEHKDGRYHRVERSYGQFFRSFRVGTDVDADAIEASYDGGVLTLRVPKAEARKPRQITVRQAASAASGDGSDVEVETGGSGES